MCKKEANI